MKSRARVFAAALVTLLAPVARDPAGLDVAAQQRGGAGVVTAGPVKDFKPVTDAGTFSEVPRVEGGGGSGGGRRTNLMHPESPDGIGEFLAMRARTGEILWRHRTRTPPNTAALTTAGGLAVVGDWDRYLYVHDAATGTILFQTRLPTSVQGFPISYAVNGKQYLAVPVGTGGGQWGTTIPAELTPEKKIAQGGKAIFVFALPETPRASPSRR